MQLMPGAWVELSVRHGLGLDPFDPRDNILAGTAYLKEMHDRSRSAGFLAAYHAGPAGYEQHLTTGEPLPPEPQPTSPRSRHCSVTSRLKARHFASNARFFGGEPPCLLSVPRRRD